jgi:stage II sporulation protein D
MTAPSWLGAAVLCWHLSVAGALPREVPVSQVLPYATGERKLRVLIIDGAKELSLRPSSDLVLETTATGPDKVLSAGASITVRPAQGGATLAAGKLRVAAGHLLLRPRLEGAPTIVSGRGGTGERSYAALSRRSGEAAAKPPRYKCAGDLEIVAADTGLRVVEHVSLEDYVAGVVAAELPSSFPLEAAKAQAIAARTYALFHLGDHRAQGADLCGGVHCQAYRGAPGAGSPAMAAAHLTAGEVLAWNGMLVDAMYHSACGGSTTAAWEVRQGKLLPYLCGADDVGESGGRPFCEAPRDTSGRHGNASPTAWERRYSWREVGRLVAANLGTVLGDPHIKVGRIESLRLVGQAQGGRAKWLAVGTDTGEYLVRGDAIRWLFGQGRPGLGGLPSTAFEMTVSRDARGRPRAVVFLGRGRGHGIGLCQWGARGRAESGQTEKDILSAYYPGAVVVGLAGGRPGGRVAGAQTSGRLSESPLRVQEHGSGFPLREQGDS